MSRVLSYRGGHLLSYAEYGDVRGIPVLVQHGMIASIRDHRLFGRLLEAGTRLICVARPGYGESSPYVMKKMAEWGEIVAALADELHLTCLDVLGISSGAPYSYAIGYKLPDKVRTIYVLSGTPALYDDRIRAHWLYPIQQDADLAELQALARELFFSDLSDDDLARNDIQDSIKNDCFGIAQDLRLRCMDWGFRLSDVRANVCMQHSTLDNQVPFVTAELTSRLLPNCQFLARATDVHFSSQLLDDFIERVMIAD